MLNNTYKKRFGSQSARTLCEQLLDLKQCGTISNYQKEFEFLSSLIHDLSEKALKITFIKELTPEIRAKVKI